MKKTILNGMLALLLLAAIGAVGCDYSANVIIEVPAEKEETPLELEVNPIAEVQITVTPANYGFLLSWPPVIDSTSYHIWRSAAGESEVYLTTLSAGSYTNRIPRYYDIIREEGGAPTLVSDTDYTYKIYASARESQVRDGIYGTKTAKSVTLLTKEEALLAAPALEVKVDGAQRKILMKMTAPGDLIFPKEVYAGVTLEWWLERDDQGEQSPFIGAKWTGVSFTALMDTEEAEVLDWEDDDFTTILKAAPFNIPGPDAAEWYRSMSGKYTVKSKYTSMGSGGITGYFTGDAGKEEVTYRNLFDYDYEGTHIPAFSASADLRIVDKAKDGTNNTTNQYVYDGVSAALALKVKGVPGANYTFERQTGLYDGGALDWDPVGAWEPVPLSIILDPYPAPGNLAALVSTDMAKWDTSVGGDPGDESYGALPSPLQTDIMGIFPYGNVGAGTPTIATPARTGLLYDRSMGVGFIDERADSFRYRIKGSLSGDEDYIETNWTTALTLPVITLTLTNVVTTTADGGGLGTTHWQYAVTPTIGDGAKNNTKGLLKDGDYVKIWWAVTGDPTTPSGPYAPPKGLNFSADKMVQIPITTANLVNNDLEDAVAVLPLTFWVEKLLLAEDDLDEVYVKIEARLGGVDYPIVGATHIVTGGGWSNTEVDINGTNYFKLNTP